MPADSRYEARFETAFEIVYEIAGAKLRKSAGETSLGG